MERADYKLVASDEEREGAFEVRRRVFIEEQRVSGDLVFDHRDGEALQMVVLDGERVIGTARVRFPARKQAKLERMAVLKPFRGRGIGKGIIAFLNGELKDRGVEQVVIHAQYEALEFYRSCGFEESGRPFQEAGMKHMKMRRRL